MKKYGVNELRQMFLDFMESKGHLVMKSFSLVPQGDKSLLLINAGMAPLKPYFTGAEKPPRTRAVSYTHLDVYKRQVCYTVPVFWRMQQVFSGLKKTNRESVLSASENFHR